MSVASASSNNIILPHLSEINRITEVLASYDFSQLSRLVIKKRITTAGEADSLVNEFSRFLLIKALDKDVDAKLYSPSLIVDEVWHTFMTMPREYGKLCGLLLGDPDAIIDHNPFGPDEAEQPVRYARTLQKYEAIVGQKPAEKFWPAAVRGHESPPLATTTTVISAINSTGESQRNKVVRQRIPSASYLQHEGPVTIQVQDGSSGKIISFKVNRSTKMYKIFQAFARHKEIIDFRFLTFITNDGERIMDDDTANSLELEDGDLIFCVRRVTGC